MYHRSKHSSFVNVCNSPPMAVRALRNPHLPPFSAPATNWNHHPMPCSPVHSAVLPLSHRWTTFPVGAQEMQPLQMWRHIGGICGINDTTANNTSPHPVLKCHQICHYMSGMPASSDFASVPFRQHHLPCQVGSIFVKNPHMSGET